MKMKINRYFSILAAAATVFAACQKDEVLTYRPENVVPPVLHPVEDVVITVDNKGEQVTFEWDKADFGFSAEVFYSLDMKLGDKSASLFSGIRGTKMAVSYEALNNKVFNDFGITEGFGEFDLILGARLNSSETFYAEPVKFKVTPTAAEKVYPMVYVLGEFCSWDSKGQMQHLFNFEEDDKAFSGVIGFGGMAADGFKIRGTEEGWDNSCNWGIQGENTNPEPSTIQLWSDGGSGNIMNYSKEFYHFTFDKTSLVLKNNKGFTQVGIIGVNNDWDNDIVMKFNPAKQVFYADVQVAENCEFKFRFDGDWNAGDYGGDLNALSQGGSNIAIEAGNYRIYLNMNNLDAVTGTIDKNAYNTGDEGFGTTPDPGPETDPDPDKPEWYIHGQTVATPGWGGTPMAKFDNNDFLAYKAENIEVTAGSEFLFKSADESQWLGVAASFAGDANPFPCVIGLDFRISGDPKVNAVINEAGNYDYWILPEAKLGYVAKAGEKPGVVANTWGLVGTVNGWGAIGDFSMTEDGTYFVRKGVVLKETDGFKIRKNNEWNDAANLGTASAGAIDINTAVPVVNSGGSQNMSVQRAGTYDIYLDFTNLKVYVMSEGKTPADAQ